MQPLSSLSNLLHITIVICASYSVVKMELTGSWNTGQKCRKIQNKFNKQQNCPANEEMCSRKLSTLTMSMLLIMKFRHIPPHPKKKKKCVKFVIHLDGTPLVNNWEIMAKDILKSVYHAASERRDPADSLRPKHHIKYRTLLDTFVWVINSFFLSPSTCCSLSVVQPCDVCQVLGPLNPCLASLKWKMEEGGRWG